MSTTSPSANAAEQAGPIQQVTPEFAAYVERVLHEEIEKIHQRNTEERQKMESAHVLREQALRSEYEQREQAFRSEIEALRARLQEAEIGPRRREQAPGGEDIDMSPPALSQHQTRGRSLSPKKQPGTTGPFPKRPADPSTPYPLPKRQKISLTTNNRRRKSSPTKKPAAHVYRVLSSELPGDVGGLKKALFTHIRILWRLERYQVPKIPPSDVLRDFLTRFSSEADLIAVSSAGPPLVDISLVSVLRAFRFSSGNLAEPSTLRVEENMLQYIQSYIAKFGFSCWCPDLRDTPYSLYNSACRIIAINTFKQALVSDAYCFLAPNVRYASDTMLILRLYDHFVHHHQYMRFHRESKNPGSVTSSEALGKAYKNRMRLAKARAKFAKAQKLPQRYINILGDVKATSDDEWDSEEQAWMIKRLPFRSEAANTFIRRFDKLWKDTTIMRGGRWCQRDRRLPSHPRDSVTRRLPLRLPLDYFDPTFYNQLLPAFRKKITLEQLAFPLDPDDILSAPGFRAEAMSDHDLMNKYGAIVLSRYDVPDESVEDMSSDGDDEDEHYDSDNDSDDEMEQDSDEDRDRRRAFARLVDGEGMEQ